ncbi:MAG: tail sheath stabilizer and completion protein [Prevotella sp.]
MLNNKPFYHRVFRKAIVAFGALFSDIKIERADKSGVVVQTIDVPIAQAPKEKWIVRIDADPNLDQHTYITLPRMSFEITGISYDPTRKINRLNRVMCPNDAGGTAKYAWAPVPYNIDISLYILTKTQEDAFQIVEQILPFFTPEFTVGVRSIEDLNIIHDIPIVLNSISQQDDYDGDFQSRRFITYTLTFTMKLNLYGPVNSAGLITKTIIDIGDTGDTSDS